MKEKDMTRQELLGVIGKKLGRLKPYQREAIMRGLIYQKKAELKRKATCMKVEVDKDGYDVSWR